MLCKIKERTWAGYVIDVVTAGGYTTFAVQEYTKCILNEKKLTLEEYKDLINHTKTLPLGRK